MDEALDEREIMVLECIKDSEEPIGSWSLVELLEARNVSISSASIGRVLYRLERLGYVEKEKSKGRVLLPAGEEALTKARARQAVEVHKELLDRYINSKVLEDYIMVLEARSAIERTTARLAAANCGEVDIARIEGVLVEQERKAALGESIADIDIEFHKGIAHASKNSVLESLYAIISTMGQQTRLFEYLRSRIASPYRVSHRQIFEAIRAHDADEAERRMIRHMECLLEDVTKYWDTHEDQTDRL